MKKSLLWELVRLAWWILCIVVPPVGILYLLIRAPRRGEVVECLIYDEQHNRLAKDAFGAIEKLEKRLFETEVHCTHLRWEIMRLREELDLPPPELIREPEDDPEIEY